MSLEEVARPNLVTETLGCVLFTASLSAQGTIQPWMGVYF